jgi:sarcosine oxidase
MREAISHRIPALNSQCVNAVTCLYTNTPDKNFVMGLHPKYPQVAIACGFSGHGFKFCSVVGEIMADLALTGQTKLDISLFNMDRLRKRTQA